MEKKREFHNDYERVGEQVDSLFSSSKIAKLGKSMVCGGIVLSVLSLVFPRELVLSQLMRLAPLTAGDIPAMQEFWHAKMGISLEEISEIEATNGAPFMHCSYPELTEQGHFQVGLGKSPVNGGGLFLLRQRGSPLALRVQGLLAGLQLVRGERQRRMVVERGLAVVVLDADSKAQEIIPMVRGEWLRVKEDEKTLISGIEEDKHYLIGVEETQRTPMQSLGGRALLDGQPLLGVAVYGG